MTRHVATLVLAFVVAAAPSALVVCELACATHHTTPGDAPAHICHETPPASASMVSADVHLCDHGNGLPESSGKQPAQDAPPPVVVASVAMALLGVDVTSIHSFIVGARSPDPVRRTTQLRI
jgi:hypothetical protein